MTVLSVVLCNKLFYVFYFGCFIAEYLLCIILNFNFHLLRFNMLLICTYIFFVKINHYILVFGIDPA